MSNNKEKEMICNGNVPPVVLGVELYHAYMQAMFNWWQDYLRIMSSGQAQETESEEE